jgi:hypothetical protein
MKDDTRLYIGMAIGAILGIGLVWAYLDWIL